MTVRSKLIDSYLKGGFTPFYSEKSREKFVNDFKGTLKVINDAFSNFEIRHFFVLVVINKNAFRNCHEKTLGK